MLFTRVDQATVRLIPRTENDEGRVERQCPQQREGKQQEGGLSVALARPFDVHAKHMVCTVRHVCSAAGVWVVELGQPHCWRPASTWRQKYKLQKYD